MQSLPVFNPPPIQQPLNVAGMYFDAYDKAKSQAQADQDRQRNQGIQDQQLATQQEQQQYNITQRPVQEAAAGASLANQKAHTALAVADLRGVQMNQDVAVQQSIARTAVMNQLDALGSGSGIVPLPVSDATSTPRGTTYGYSNDPYSDSNSSAGIGAFVSDQEAAQIKAGEDTPNKLKPGDMAVSSDMVPMLKAANVQPGDPFTIHYADGTSHTGRYMDHTADSVKNKDGSVTPVKGRFDVYSPSGVDGNPGEGKRVAAISRGAAGDPAPGHMPTYEQLEQAKRLASIPLYAHDPIVQGKYATMEALNGIRPDIIAQRNAVATGNYMQQFSQGSASLPGMAESLAVARASGIGYMANPDASTPGAPPFIVNPGSLPPADKPELWQPIIQRQQEELAKYRTNPAQYMQMQGGQLQRQPLPAGLVSSNERLAGVLAKIDPVANPDLYHEVHKEWRATQDTINAFNEPIIPPGGKSSAQISAEAQAARAAAAKAAADTSLNNPAVPLTLDHISTAASAANAQQANQEWTDGKATVAKTLGWNPELINPDSARAAAIAVSEGKGDAQQIKIVNTLHMAGKIVKEEPIPTGEKVLSNTGGYGAVETPELLPAADVHAAAYRVNGFKAGPKTITPADAVRATAQDVLARASAVFGQGKHAGAAGTPVNVTAASLFQPTTAK